MEQHSVSHNAIPTISN